MNSPTATRSLRRLLLLLVIVLTFEGLLRKKAPYGLKELIFFSKDLLTLVIGFKVFRMQRPPAIDFLWKAYGIAVFLFIPVLLATAFHDPLLAVFGAKQYLLFPLIGMATFMGFQDTARDEIARFFRWTALLVIPTCLVALLQLRLPADHWLNLSVAGESLEGFSAGGKLRVSSTFPFVSQYAIFLNAEVYVVMVALSQMEGLKRAAKALYLSLIPLLILSSYITGSRTAVVGNASIVAIACALVLFKFRAGTAIRLGLIVAGLYLAFLGVRHFSPESFVAYAAREEGKLIGVSSEVQGRTFDSLFGWLEGGGIAPPSLLGYGLGVMSNGSNAFSRYAAGWRAGGVWTETDLATTLFEGGFYLIAVWYGFRFYVIYQTARRFLFDVHGQFASSGAFCQAYVILTGAIGTLAIQPPVAIWWWLAVGASLTFWWKSVEPVSSADGSGDATVVPARPAGGIRGRSVYAERLHSHHEP